jgi:hypothetical protein
MDTPFFEKSNKNIGRVGFWVFFWFGLGGNIQKPKFWTSFLYSVFIFLQDF